MGSSNSSIVSLIIPNNIPQELKDINQWVCWKAVHKRNAKKPTKIPYSPKTLKAASTTDSKTWGTFDEAYEALKKSKDFTGIGFVFTSRDPYIGIDLDNCIDEDGELDSNSELWTDIFDSYTELSPSRKGLHIIVRGEILKSLKTDKYEIYDKGRYFTITGQPVGGAFPECGDISKDQEALNQFVNIHFGTGRKSDSVWSPAQGEIKGNRNNTLVSVLGKMLSIGMRKDETEILIDYFNENYCNPPLDPEELDKTVLKAIERYAKDPEAEEEKRVIGEDIPELDKLVERYAYAEALDRFIVKQSGLQISPEAVNRKNAAIKIPVETAQGKRYMKPVNALLQREDFVKVDHITWWPGKDEVFTDTRDHITYYNTYRAPDYSHIDIKGKSVKLWLDHVKYIIPDERERETFLDWMAYTVQHPEKKINYAILLGGEERIGKDLIIVPVTRMLAGFYQEVTVLDLLSRFNGYLRQTLFLVIEEIYVPTNRDRREMENKLKGLNAAPPAMLRLEDKNDKSFPIANVVKPFYMTNHQDALVLSDAEAPRYFCIWSPAKRKDVEYYTKILDWYEEKNGIGAVAHYLLTRDVSKFDTTRSPFTTQFTQRVAKESKGALEYDIQNAYEQDLPPFDKTLFKIEDLKNALNLPNVHPVVLGRALRNEGFERLEKLYRNKVGKKSRVVKFICWCHKEDWDQLNKETGTTIHDLYMKERRAGANKNLVKKFMEDLNVED